MTRAWPLLCGSFPVTGLLLGGAGVDAREVRRRVLREWRPGVRVYSAGARTLMLFAEQRRMRSDLAPGALVVEREHRFTTLAIDEDSLVAFGLRHLVTSEAGELRSYRIGPEAEIDLASWLELDGFDFLDSTPLGAPPPPTRAAFTEARDVRDALGDKIPPLEPAAVAMRRELKGIRDADAPAALPPTATIAESLRTWGRSWLEGWARWFAGGRGDRPRVLDSPSSTAEGPVKSGETALATRPGFFDSIFDQLKGWAASLVLRTHLGTMLERRQAEYLARTLELFEQGKFEEALKWAIPLEGDSDSSGGKPAALGVPTPRSSLTISLRRAAPRTTIGIVGAFDLLQAQYRKSLKQLIDRGRVDEAAYLLAELLGDSAGAVSLLEEHGRFEEAARLAEARKQPSAVVIRLWLLAGQPDRALLIARRDEVFAETIGLMREKHPEQAKRLALLWADSRASHGDYDGAVHAVLEFPEMAPLFREWLTRGTRLGGPVAARLLALRAQHDISSWDSTRDLALALLRDASEERTAERVALAHALTRVPLPNDAVRLLGKATLRAITRDAALGLPTDRSILRLLAAVANSPLLRAETPTLPKLTASAGLRTRAEALIHRIDESDRGALPIAALVAIPNGQIVVATGESGIHLLTSKGKRIQHFDAPADDLVESDHGYRLIAVSETGSLKRLTRIDLESRRARLWCHRELLSYARTFDGSRWLILDVGHRPNAHIIDVVSDEWRGLWTLSDEPLVGVDRQGGSYYLMSPVPTASDAEVPMLALWRYAERGMRLLSREHVGPWARDLRVISARASNGQAWIAALDLGADRVEGRLVRLIDRRQAADPFSDEMAIPEGALPLRFEVSAAWLVAASLLRHERHASEIRVRVLTLTGFRVVMEIVLEGSTRVDLRLRDNSLWLGDERGRIVHTDLHRGIVTHDLRLMP